MNAKWGLVCLTLSGLTMSSDDIYETEEAAYLELADMQKARLDAGMDPDEDFSVIKIFQRQDGSWEDDFGEAITVTGGAQ